MKSSKKTFRKIRINHKKTVNIALETLLKKKKDLKNQFAELDNLEDIKKSVEAAEHIEKVLEFGLSWTSLCTMKSMKQ